LGNERAETMGVLEFFLKSGSECMASFSKQVPPPKRQRCQADHHDIAGDSHECSVFLKTVFDDWLPETRRAFAAAHPVANIPSRVKTDRQRKPSRGNRGHAEEQ
jgi:hypothetical protein